MVPRTSPFTITWLPVSLVGFNKIGFIYTEGVIPAASACITCARPISKPSSVIKELSAMFCDLKGATLYPSCLKIRHSPAVRRLFPALDMVPCTIIAFAIICYLPFSWRIYSFLLAYLFTFLGVSIHHSFRLSGACISSSTCRSLLFSSLSLTAIL